MINQHLFDDIIEKAEEVKSKSRRPVAVFDLDGTLFVYTPRVKQVLLDALDGKEDQFPGIKTLIENIPHTSYEYLVVDTLKKYDISMPGLEDHLLTFWERWFFDNKYIKHDYPLPGAVEFVNKLSENGIFIVYLTGRDWPRMGKGTEESLIKSGFPMDKNNSKLIMKPRFEDDNWAHKNRSINEINVLGDVVAAFDNEPGEANILADNFPSAVVVMVHNIHSPGAPPLRESLRHIENFNDGYLK
ncbi:MAG: hypothetical protein GF307_04255 [candidate division Zixibacteria bacterium]|nr:hypothetical protein [candidate division Zixibacteria bacterium]